MFTLQAFAIDWSKDYKLELDLSNFTTFDNLMHGIVETTMASIEFDSFNFVHGNFKKVIEYRYLDTPDNFLKNRGYILFTTLQLVNSSQFCVYTKFSSLDYDIALYNKVPTPDSSLAVTNVTSRIETNFRVCPQAMTTQVGAVCIKKSTPIISVKDFQQFFPHIADVASPSYQLVSRLIYRTVFEYNFVTMKSENIKFSIGCNYNTKEEAIHASTIPFYCDLSFKSISNTAWGPNDLPRLQESYALFEKLSTIIPNHCIQVFFLSYRDPLSPFPPPSFINTIILIFNDNICILIDLGFFDAECH